MSVVLSAKNNFDLSNGDLAPRSDSLVDFGSVSASTGMTGSTTANRISSAQLLAAQRLLRSGGGSPAQSPALDLKSSSSSSSSSAVLPSPEHNSYPDRHSPLSSSSSSLHNLHHHHHHHLLHSRHTQPIDQPTPEDSSSSDHSPSNSRSNSPTIASDSIDTSRPAPTQLVAMANELLNQLKTLNGCSSPTGLSSALSIGTTAASPVAPSPCVTFNLCNGQMQRQSSTKCTSVGPKAGSAATASHAPSPRPHNSSAASHSETNQRRLYHIPPSSVGMHSGEFLATLAEMRRCQQLLDCCLFCEQQQLRAHKLVLAACSPFFRAMFAGISGCNNSTVVIPDVPLVDLQVLIRIAYGELCGSVRLSDRRVMSLWRSAKRLQMRTVCQFMIRNQLLATRTSCESYLDTLTDAELDALHVTPAGNPIDDGAIELTLNEDDANVLEQLDQLDFQHSTRFAADRSPIGSKVSHRLSPDTDRLNCSDSVSASALNMSTTMTTTTSAASSHSPLSTTTTSSSAATNNHSSNDEMNVISAIAALSQAAAAAVSSNAPMSTNRHRFGSIDLSTSTRNDQPIDLVCPSSAKEVDVESDSSSNATLFRQMQQAIAAQSQSMAQSIKSSHKSNHSLATSEALLSQMALNGGALSPTTRALLLATAGLDLQSSVSTSQTSSITTANSSQLSPVAGNDLNSSTASQLMAAAQQQLFGQLTGFAGLGVTGNTISSLNALQPVKRGRGRPPRHTQPRDLDEESSLSKEHRYSPPQPEAIEMSAPKRWRPNMETILALKARNKLVSGPLPLVNSSHKAPVSSVSSGVSSMVGGATGSGLVNLNGSSFDRMNGNNCAGSLIGSTNGLTLPGNVSSASGLNLSSSGVGGNGSSCTLSSSSSSSSSSAAATAVKSLMGKLPNDRNGNGGPDNKNVCPFCPQVYYSNQAMNDHINNVHTKNSTKYVCDVCGKEFSWKISLVKHQKTHSNGASDASSMNHATGITSVGDAISVPVTMGNHSPLLAHQMMNQQLTLNKFGSGSVGTCNALSAQQLLSNGDLFKNLMNQRDSVEMPAIKFD
jgi:hypothetical protein